MPLDSCRYVWRKDDHVPTRFKRELGGGELIEDAWTTYNRGEQNLFLGLYITISQPLDVTEFVELLTKAWISTRWDVPTIASQVLHEPREATPIPTVFLTYDLPQNASWVEIWAQRTIILKHGYEDLDGLRYDIGYGIIPAKDLEPQTFIYVLQLPSNQFGLLFHTSHVPFDGAGLKMVGSKLLEHLSQYIADSSYASLEVMRMKWGSEGSQLLPTASDVLPKQDPTRNDAVPRNVTKPELSVEPREGSEYFATLMEIMQNTKKGNSVSIYIIFLSEKSLDIFA